VLHLSFCKRYLPMYVHTYVDLFKFGIHFYSAILLRIFLFAEPSFLIENMQVDKYVPRHADMCIQETENETVPFWHVSTRGDVLTLASKSSLCVTQGCQIFLGTIYQSGKNTPNDYKITKWPQNIPNGRKILQMTKIYQNNFHSKVLQKFIQIGIFGLKRNHLATLMWHETADKTFPPFFDKKFVTLKATYEEFDKEKRRSWSHKSVAHKIDWKPACGGGKRLVWAIFLKL
jgi:hypothetical protein